MCLIILRKCVYSVRRFIVPVAGVQGVSLLAAPDRCGEILKIGTLFNRPQPVTRIESNWDFFRLPLSSSFGQFCSRSTSDPNPTNFWADEMECRGVPHFRTEDLL